MSKILLVTGASSEVGIELIKTVRDQYDLILAQYCHSKDALDALAGSDGARIELLWADFSDIASVERMIAEIREKNVIPSHIVHLPAPKAYNQKFHKDRWENFEKGIEISLHSLVAITQAFLPSMVKARYGKLCIMLTSCTLNQPPKYQASYVTVKYALLGFMKSLAVEYADKGITVNGVSPDMMETKFLSDVPELIVAQNAARNPLGRNIRVDDVVPAMAYLLSDAADAVTGQNIAVTGGIA